MKMFIQIQEHIEDPQTLCVFWLVKWEVLHVHSSLH